MREADSPGKARLLCALPSVILVLVASLQVVLARTEALSPWSGGGFGMFSTLDHGSQRHLHAFVLRPGLRREVVPPAALAGAIASAMTLPTEARLRHIATALADTPTPDYGPATGVQVQVWRARFDPETLAKASRILREFTLSLERRD